MFIFIASAFLLTAWAASRADAKDHADYDRLRDEEARRLLLLHIRQSLRFIGFILAAILLMLSIIGEDNHWGLVALESLARKN